MKKMLFLSLLISVSSTSVFAALKTTVVKNSSKNNVKVLGFGLGCAGLSLGRGLMCGVTPITLKPGQSALVKYQTRIGVTQGGIRLVAMEDQGFYEAKADKRLPKNINFSVKKPGRFEKIASPMKGLEFLAPFAPAAAASSKK